MTGGVTTPPLARSVADLLAGIVVVERSRTVGGAYAGLALADLGAEVYRIAGPIDVVTGQDESVRAAVIQSLCRGKTIVSTDDVDLQDTVLRRADVLVIDDWDDNDVERQRLLAAAPAGVIHASVQALGRRPGPDGARIPGNGLTACAWAGLSIVIGSQGKAPLTLPFDLPDYEAGVNLAAATVLALIERDMLTGRTPAVEVSTAETLAYYTGMITANFIPYGRAWRREGRRASGSGGVYPLGIFDAKDGLVAVLCRTPREWHSLLEAMGNPDWSANPEFRDPRNIARHKADQADQHLIPWLSERTTHELVKLGQDFSVPIAAIRTMAEAISDPQLEARRYFQHTGPAEAPLVPGPPFVIQASAAGTDRLHWPASAKDRTNDPERLLHGLRVLDFSWVWSGPMVTSILCDLGAEIIKVEHESRMDPARLRGRAVRDGIPVAGPEHEVTPYFNQMNHGKQSLNADITTAAGRALLLDIASTCDVVVENLRPGVLERHGLGYGELAAKNPGLVMLSMSMAGQDGPLRNLKGYASIMSAMAGIESLIGYDDHDIVGMLTPAFGDPNGAAHGMGVLLAALYHRSRNGGYGMWIDLSQIEAMMSVLRSPIAESQVRRAVSIPANIHPDHVPHGHFPGLEDDRWIALSVRSDEQWRSLCELAGTASGLLDLAELDIAGRRSRRADIDRAVAQWTCDIPVHELAAMLLSRGIAAAVVHTFEEMVKALSNRPGDLCSTVHHPYLGDQLTFFVPWRFEGKTAGRRVPAPLLGADTDKIISEATTESEQVADK